MAIATTWLTTATNVTSNVALYTVNTTAGAYQRDLVITNSGTALGYVVAGASATTAAAATGFVVPTGGTVILTQCGIPASTKIFGFSANGTNFSIGLASNVTYE